MEKKILFILFFFSCLCNVKALDIKEIQGKEIAFYEPENVNIRYDCFFNYNPIKPMECKTAFASDGKYTKHNEILGHIFHVDSVLYRNYKQGVSGGTIIILTREDGLKITMKTPKYKDDRMYKKPKSLSYSFIKTTSGTLGNFNSYLDFDVYNISYGKELVYRLLNTNRTVLNGNFIQMPKIEDRGIIFENNVPLFKICINEDVKKYSLAALLDITTKRELLNKHASYVDSIITKYRPINIDSLNRIYAGKDLWVSPWMFKSSEIPVVHYVKKYKTLDTLHPHDWMFQSYKTFEEGAIGGSKWEFLKVIVDTIGIMPGLKPGNCINYDYDYLERRDWPKYLYYIKLTPLPNYEYKRDKYDINSKILGSELNDTIYIPFDSCKINYLYSNVEIEQFEKDFMKQEQRAWNEYMEMQHVKSKILNKAYGRENGANIAAGKIRFGYSMDMCEAAFEGKPFKITSRAHTPLGKAVCYDFYTEDIKLYFIDDELIGIKWKGNAIKYRM